METRQAREELTRCAKAMSNLLDQIAELQGQVKELKAAAKADGYDMKAFGQIIKEMRRGPEFQSDQLSLELVIDTYRTAVGLPTDIEEAQEAAREAAAGLPARKGGLNDAVEDGAPETTISINGGPPHPMSVVRAAVGAVKAAKASAMSGDR